MVALLVAGQFLAAQNWRMITISADGSETSYALSDVQKIVFENNTMTVNLTSGSNTPDITCIRFSAQTGLKTLQTEGLVLVFPNPVQTNLTVSGVEKDAKINLFNLTGTFLQSIPAQENSTSIDVSSLPQGSYLLQVGKQTVKFIKQ